jgi:hypothetical protein
LHRAELVSTVRTVFFGLAVDLHRSLIKQGQIFAFCSDPPLPKTVILIQILAAVSAGHLLLQTAGHIWMQINRPVIE